MNVLNLKISRILAAVLVMSFVAGVALAVTPNPLETHFVTPPDSARPWVFWFWHNGNITRVGITKDLEAMKRAGIGGAVIFEVDQGVPAGPVAMMSGEWQQLFAHALDEASRLGIEVNMHNGPGWCGSGGPWVPLEKAMQMVVTSETRVPAGLKFAGVLPQPQTVEGYYRDIAVMAFPTPHDPDNAAHRIRNMRGKALMWTGHHGMNMESLDGAPGDDVPKQSCVARDKIMDLTAQMDAEGRLAWDAPVLPEGDWTVLRFGHTFTGAKSIPAPASGTGPECDKLAKEGIEASFNGMLGPLAQNAGALCGKTLVATHTDSWEMGSQNWTPKMREEFRRRRGYDLTPYLPVMAGRVVESTAISERFLRDVRQTVADLLTENYVGHLRTLAARHGLKLTMECYTTPGNDQDAANQIDEPIAEFWWPNGGGLSWSVKAMASAAHVNGNPIVGAEAFTDGGLEKWMGHPANMKPLGDRAFCGGINRFCFHRYTLQPWAEDRRPGMTMGPYGHHYERTQTWWNDAKSWHEYLSRCQYLLRQGRFVADVLSLQSLEPADRFQALSLSGYDFDGLGPQAFMKNVVVKDGLLALPSGMKYRLLVLPKTATMTPEMLEKISVLVAAGAAVLGEPPLSAPGLTDYPQCDEQVKNLARQLWGERTEQERTFGNGRVFRGLSPEQALAKLGVPQDFTSDPALNWIHRTVSGTEIYFVANPQPKQVMAMCGFRVTGLVPELWHPESGRTEPAGIWTEKNGRTTVALPLESYESVFIVFRQPSKGRDPIVSLQRDGKNTLSAADARQKPILIRKATYGVPNDPGRTVDATARVRELVESGKLAFGGYDMLTIGDPAPGVVKALTLVYEDNGVTRTVSRKDGETISLTPQSDVSLPPAATVHAGTHNWLEVWDTGDYQVVAASGKTLRAHTQPVLAPLALDGPWKLRFAPNLGAPEEIALDHLIHWNTHPDDGVKYFSGAATYYKALDIPANRLGAGQRLYLDLGRVEIMAEVTLNGRNLGLLWKPPYRVDMTDAAKAGANDLQIRVVNLWPNRMIGDETLPEDSPRNPDGATLPSWPQWILDGKPSPTGRFTFTTWRLWKKGEVLLDSGWIGPARLVSSQRVELK